MTIDELLTALRASLEAIDHPRFYETERGFQGELIAQLQGRTWFQPTYITEQEHQKKEQWHGLRIRPDIIIHWPFDPAFHRDRTEGNLVAFELKLNATSDEAKTDFAKLGLMIERLRYPLGVFVNIGSEHAFAELMPTAFQQNIAVFGVALVEGRARVAQYGPTP